MKKEMKKRAVQVILCLLLTLSFSFNSFASYTDWKQGAVPWGSARLGNLCTMGNSGCLITSIAILMAKSHV